MPFCESIDEIKQITRKVHRKRLDSLARSDSSETRDDRLLLSVGSNSGPATPSSPDSSTTITTTLSLGKYSNTTPGDSGSSKTSANSGYSEKTDTSCVSHASMRQNSVIKSNICLPNKSFSIPNQLHLISESGRNCLTLPSSKSIRNSAILKLSNKSPSSDEKCLLNEEDNSSDNYDTHCANCSKIYSPSIPNVSFPSHQPTPYLKDRKSFYKSGAIPKSTHGTREVELNTFDSTKWEIFHWKKNIIFLNSNFDYDLK